MRPLGHGMVEGFVDHYGRDHVKGWAWNGRQPDTPVQLEVRVGERVLATMLADQYRADVVLEGSRSGKQGFEVWFDEPLSVETAQQIEVRVQGMDVVLPVSGAAPVLYEMPSLHDRLTLPLCESPFMEQIIERDSMAPERAALVREFSKNGLLKFRIIDPNFDRLADEIVESLSDKYRSERRVQDAWTFNDSVRTLACLPQVLEMLELLYGRAAIPMQTLNFPVGTEQSTHSDSVHFNCMPKRFMCGVWVALEPITLNNGPLHYYPGSHQLPIVDLDDLGLVADPGRWSANYEAHQEVLHEFLRLHGSEKQILEADRGDAIIWAANLCHGGEPIADPGSSRHSQVTHYYFEGCAYYSPMLSNVFMGQVCRPDRRDIRTGEPILPVFGHARIPLDIPLEPGGRVTPAGGATTPAAIGPTTPGWRASVDQALKTARRASRRATERWSSLRRRLPTRFNGGR